MSTSSPSQMLEQAVQHHQAGQLADAERLYRQILRQNPEDSNAMHLLGVLALQTGHHAQAEPFIRHAIRLAPRAADYHANLGVVLAALHRYDEAAASFRESLALRPDDADAMANLAAALRELRQPQEAAELSQRAIALRPESAPAWNNLGNALRDLDRSVEAITAYRRAVQLKPDYADAHLNLGLTLHSIGRYDEAASKYRQISALWPGRTEAEFNHGLLLLLRGDFQSGWVKHERRLQPDHAAEQWTGQPLDGKTLLVRAEQGFGDTFQFVRYLPLLENRGARVIFECHPEQVTVLAGLQGTRQLVPRGQPLPAADFCASLLSLPYIFQTDLTNIPASVPYLSADQARVIAWEIRVPKEDGKLNVGLVWAGRPQHVNDRNRSASLQDLAPLSRVSNARFYSLQLGAAAAQGQTPPSGLALTNTATDLHDFADTAALLARLDLLISVDTAVAHLGGALGRPVLMLLPVVPDFRWLLHRSDTPWYPTMKLFRQVRAGDWSEPVHQIVEEILRLT